MRKVVLGLLAVAVVAFALPRLGRVYDGFRAMRSARSRVEQLLGAMQAARGSSDAPETRTAACLWFKGTLVILDRDELIAAERGFAVWRERRRLDGSVGSWRIESVALPDPHLLTTVLVVATVDERVLPLTVQQGQPVS